MLVAVEDEGGSLIVVRHPGPRFAVSAVFSSLVGAGQRENSGPGVSLIDQFMDEVRYEGERRELRRASA